MNDLTAYIDKATAKVLPPGYKAEDYAEVDDALPMRIAIIIVQEAKHMQEMDRRHAYGYLRRRSLGGDLARTFQTIGMPIVKIIRKFWR